MPEVTPPQTPEDSALAQLQMLLAGGASVDLHQLLGQKEARLIVVTQALAVAIEELKKWASLGLPYDAVRKLVVPEGSMFVEGRDLAGAELHLDTSETVQNLPVE